MMKNTTGYVYGYPYVIGGIVLSFLLVIGINILSSMVLRPFSWDVTENSLFTLNDSTHSVLQDMDEPVKVRFFFSDILGERYPSILPWRDRIKTLLEQFADISGGKVQLEYLNPVPFSETEDQAVAFGLQAIPLGTSGEQAYFGLAATNTVDRVEVIPIFGDAREMFIEYDLIRIIYQLVQPEGNTVGILSTIPLHGGGQVPPLGIYTEIEENFDTLTIDPQSGVIPDAVNTLLVVNPAGLNAEMLRATERFALGGGGVLMFTDGYIESLAPAMRQRLPHSQDYQKLLKAWGVRMVTGKTAADRDAAKRVNYRDSNGRVREGTYVSWLGLKSRHMDQEDALSAQLASIAMGSAGILELEAEATTTRTVLFRTGTDSMRIDAVKLGPMQPDIQGLLRDFEPSGQEEILGVRITGPAQTAYEDNENADSLTHGKNINVVIIADVDMLFDHFWVQQQELLGQRVRIPLSANGDLVIGALENLGGGSVLAGLRARRATNRPFTLVNDIQREAEVKYRMQETALQTRLKEIQARLRGLVERTGVEAEGLKDVLITAEMQQEMDTLTTDMLSTRRALREVQFELRRDIENVQRVLVIMNVVVVPLVLLLGAFIALWLYRRSLRKGSMA